MLCLLDQKKHLLWKQILEEMSKKFQQLKSFLLSSWLRHQNGLLHLSMTITVIIFITDRYNAKQQFSHSHFYIICRMNQFPQIWFLLWYAHSLSFLQLKSNSILRHKVNLPFSILSFNIKNELICLWLSSLTFNNRSRHLCF